MCVKTPGKQTVPRVKGSRPLHEVQQINDDSWQNSENETGMHSHDKYNVSYFW